MSRLRIVSVATLAAALSLTAAACTTTTEPTFRVDPLPQPDPVIAPVVVQRDRSTVEIPDARKATCLVEPGKTTPAPTCPVLEFNGRSYWALSYTDNRGSLNVVGYDSAGVMTGEVELTGARYIYQMRVVEADSTVVLVGQGEREVRIRWVELP